VIIDDRHIGDAEPAQRTSYAADVSADGKTMVIDMDKVKVTLHQSPVSR
jgi:hypothetical protein